MKNGLQHTGLAVIFSIGASAAATAAPVTYDGITFPGGVESFADSVFSYAPGPGVSSTYDDPSQALGAPNDDDAGVNFVSLGTGGSLILEFTDNSLTTSGDATPDLHVFEIGGAVEEMIISISSDMLDWIDLGRLEGQPTSIDIDGVSGVSSGTQYSFVRIIDGEEGLSGSPFAGADIDAVGAISSAPPVPDTPSPVPLPAAGWLLIGALGGLGVMRRFQRS